MLWLRSRARFPSHCLLSCVTLAVYTASLNLSNLTMLGGFRKTGYNSQSRRITGCKFILP